jgi:hypothetical protein
LFCSNRFIPESIPWLVAKKKYGEAKKVTKWAAKINGISFPKHLFVRVRVMVFNATFNNISAISWRSVLLVEESGEPGENH